MKSIVALAAVLLLTSGMAVASGSSNNCKTCGNPPANETNVGASSKSNSNADSKSSSKSNSNADSNSNASNDNSGNTEVNVDGGSTTYSEKRRPVNTAYAAPLVAGDDTCMGSTSAGGMGITFGFSFATTWKDDDCVIRKDARFLQNAQRQDIALSLMCEKPSVIAAVKRAGTDAEKRACGLDVSPRTPVTTVILPTPRPRFPGERG